MFFVLEGCNGIIFLGRFLSVSDMVFHLAFSIVIDGSKLFGIFRDEGGFSERANIIINEDQEIEFVRIYEISELPDINEILTFLRGDE